jgi:hypothetical protein
MGLLFSLFGAHPNTTKMKVAGLTASAVDYAINNEGLGNLVDGSIVLDKKLHPTFRGGKPERRGSILAVAAIRDLEEAEILKFISRIELQDPSMYQPYLGQLIDALMRKFESECPDFAALPKGESS